MATGTLFPAPWFTVLDANGDPVSGAKGYFYLAGTTTLVATYSDVALTTANANPVIADSSGRIGPVYLSPGSSVKLVLQESTGASIRTQDNISAIPGQSLNVDVPGVAGEALSLGYLVYLSDGSGGKTAGSWYKADATTAYSSTLPLIGYVPTAIESGATGSIRLEGQILTGVVVVGTSYYVSATPGLLAGTAPPLSRFVGVADTVGSIVFKPNDPASLITAGQLVFPATQNASTDVNTLDDYEEGTWTPALGGSTSETGQVYTIQVGRYVKVGKLVTVNFVCVLSTLGTITGNLTLKGLPFTVENVTNSNFTGPIFWSAMTSSYVNVALLTIANSTTATFYGATAAATGLTAIAQADLSATSNLQGTLTYRATA